MTLGEYIKQAGTRPFEPAVHDCCTFPAGWALRWGMGDPMARWRCRYWTEDQASDLIAEAGGLVALWMRGLADIGVQQVDTLQAGDIGVIRMITPGRENDVGAIYTGRRWAFLTEAGVASVSADHLAAWGWRDG